ncbi:putative DNA helicase [Dioscorea sansibarensis]
MCTIVSIRELTNFASSWLQVIIAIMSILTTTLPGCGNSFQRASKAPLPVDKEEKKMVIGYVEKVSTIWNSGSISATSGIFAAEMLGTFTRKGLFQWSSPPLQICYSKDTYHLCKYPLKQHVVIDVEVERVLNEENDLRSLKGLEWDIVFIHCEDHCDRLSMDRDGHLLFMGQWDC